MSDKRDDERRYVCVECGAAADSLYIQYSPQVLKLTQCKHCEELVDRYVEFSIVNVMIDLMLHRIAAYRHVLRNIVIHNEWRIFIVFALCGAYDRWMTRKLYESAEQHQMIDNLDALYQNEINSTTDDLEPNTLADLEWRFYECALHATLDIAVFIGAAIVTASCMQKTPINWHFVARALMLAYYGNVFVVLSIVWRLHYFVSYVLLTRLMVFCAHVQSTRVSTTLSKLQACICIVIASLVELAVSWGIVRLLYSEPML